MDPTYSTVANIRKRQFGWLMAILLHYLRVSLLKGIARDTDVQRRRMSTNEPLPYSALVRFVWPVGFSDARRIRFREHMEHWLVTALRRDDYNVTDLVISVVPGRAFHAVILYNPAAKQELRDEADKKAAPTISRLDDRR